MRTLTRKGMVRKLDNLCREYVKLRDKRCITHSYKCSDVMQCGHLFSRATYSTRWDPRNIYLQCSSCNLKHEHSSWPMTEQVIAILGKRRFKELYQDYSRTNKFTNQDLLSLIEWWQERIKEYGKVSNT
jgi:hypothetical protein